MRERKFLTVMAVFDSETQNKLAKIQSEITEQVGEGTQTMGIPFHLTLGSYPIDMQDLIVDKIKYVASISNRFKVSLLSCETFGDKVHFLKPDIPQELLDLRKSFECDYANGFEWVPHATIFCGEADEVKKIKAILKEVAEPISTEIVGIELGEFFPPRKIIRIDFKN